MSVLTRSELPAISIEPFQGSPDLTGVPQPNEMNWAELARIDRERPGQPIFKTNVVTRGVTPLKVTQALDLKGDKILERDDTGLMTETSREDLSKTLSAIEERMDKRVERMERDTERRTADLRRENDLRDASARNEQALRDRSLDERINGFLAAQAERDKAQLERDKRYEMLAERVTQAAEGAEEAAKQAATVKANYWAAVAVQLLAVVGILAGAYFANQANILGAMQTTMGAFQAGKAEGTTPSPPPQPAK